MRSRAPGPRPAASRAPWPPFARREWRPETVQAWLAEALVSPVLTAHPTEVQRRSILDCEREIVRLLTLRDRTALAPSSWRNGRRACELQVLALWHTAMLRTSKLTVHDEVDNGLAYYRYTFLAEVPRVSHTLAQRARSGVRPRVHGAARDAHGLVDRRRPRRQSVRDGRHAGVCIARAGGGGLRALSRIGACARRGARALHAPRGTHARAHGAGRGRARSQSASQRRALPAGAHRHLRPRGGHVDGAVGTRAVARADGGPAAVRNACAIARRPRDPARFARIARCAAPGRPAPVAAHARGGYFRLPPGVARPAPERRRARAGAGRPPRARRGVPRLPGTRRGCARGGARGRDRLAASIGVAAPRLRRAHARRSSRSWPTRPTCIGATARRRCPTTSSASASRCRTCSRSRCCSRRRAC